MNQPIQVRNVDSTSNSRDVITHEVKVNIFYFYKEHIEKVWMDVYELRKTDIILGMLWLVAHNPEIDWEKWEVRIIRCLPLYRKCYEPLKPSKVIFIFLFF